MTISSTYIDQIKEIFQDNGWEGLLEVELEAVDQLAQTVHVRLSQGHASAPGDLVNIYQEGVHPLEQVQQECLRALRTGRPGI